MSITRTIVTTCLLAAAAAAQTQTVRGEVEDVQGTANQFFLKCTNIPVVSNAVNLQQLVNQNQQLVMQVVDVGTPGNPVLDIQSAVAIARVMDMGNLRLGQSARWEVNHTPGSLAFVFVNLTNSTSYVPAGSLGTLLVGFGAQTMRSGFVNGQGQFEFDFTMPNLPALVGTDITSQALVIGPGGLSPFLSNPDCKEIQQ